MYNKQHGRIVRPPNQPQPRKAIHPSWQLSQPEMGRYGAYDDPKSVDEVDNASLPTNITGNLENSRRKKSLDNNEWSRNLHSDDNRDDFMQHIHDMRKEYNDTKSTNSSSFLYNDSYQSQITESDDETLERTETSEQNQITFKQILIFVIVILAAIAVPYILNANVSEGSKNIYDEYHFVNDLNSIAQKYKLNDNSILELQTGISTIFERNDTGSFIFIYNSKYVNFNNFQFTNFIGEVATVAARYLRNHSKSIEPTILHSSQLNMATHSELMNKYRNEISESGVLLVNDVDRIPSTLAMAFHYFCDEYNPLVAKTAIFFTLNLSKCSFPQEQKSTYVNIENCLASKWSGMPKDNIKPLLARVVNVVIDVTNLF